MPTISIANTDSEIQRCFKVMVQLRTHLIESEFVARIRRQQKLGYNLVFLEDAGEVLSVAGFRIAENLYAGRYLYVDDLSTHESVRSQGHGGMLFDWLVNYAKSDNCDVLALDSGVQRFGAHRFYLGKRMDIVSHHFRLKLK